MFGIFVLIVTTIVLIVGIYDGNNFSIIISGLLFGILGMLVNVVIVLNDIHLKLKERK